MENLRKLLLITITLLVIGAQTTESRRRPQLPASYYMQRSSTTLSPKEKAVAKESPEERCQRALETLPDLERPDFYKICIPTGKSMVYYYYKCPGGRVYRDDVQKCVKAPENATISSTEKMTPFTPTPKAEPETITESIVIGSEPDVMNLLQNAFDGPEEQSSSSSEEDSASASESSVSSTRKTIFSNKLLQSAGGALGQAVQQKLLKQTFLGIGITGGKMKNPVREGPDEDPEHNDLEKIEEFIKRYQQTAETPGSNMIEPDSATVLETAATTPSFVTRWKVKLVDKDDNKMSTSAPYLGRFPGLRPSSSQEQHGS